MNSCASDDEKMLLLVGPRIIVVIMKHVNTTNKIKFDKESIRLLKTLLAAAFNYETNTDFVAARKFMVFVMA